MQETTRLAGLIQERIDDTISQHLSELEALGPDPEPLFAEARAYLAGGKRMRAQFAVLGFQAVRPLDLVALASPLAHDASAMLQPVAHPPLAAQAAAQDRFDPAIGLHLDAPGQATAHQFG